MKDKKNACTIPPLYTGFLTQKFREAEKLIDKNPQQACHAFLEIILCEDYPKATISDTTDEIPEDPLRVKEAAVFSLGTNQIKNRQLNGLKESLEKLRPFFTTIPKVRTAKIVRSFIDLLSDVPNSSEIQEELCLDTIEWTKKEKRTFLRHRVETRLAQLYYKTGQYTQASKLLQALLHEVKKLEDKLLLVEIHYLDARVYLSLRNISKSKAALTTARNYANSIHCPPLLLAEIDILAGELQLEDNDPKTAFAYFLEAFDAYNAGGEKVKALTSLKYAMLTKIIGNQPDDVSNLIMQKKYLPYSCRETDCLIEIAKTYKAWDLKTFEFLIEKYKSTYLDEVKKDCLILRYTKMLYESLLEQNILKVLKPYSSVELTCIAQKTNLPLYQVHRKLSQMILDKQLAGSLDQSSGILQLFDEEEMPTAFEDTIAIYKNMCSVVDLLHQKSQIYL